MAKKKKKNLQGMGELEEEKAGSKVAVVLVGLLIILIWIAIFVLCVRWDVGGFGSTVLEPVLKDVPVINKILPDTEEEKLITDDNYPYATLNEAISRIKQLEKELAAAKESENEAITENNELEAEVARLKKFEDNQAEFERQKKEFYEKIVYTENAPDISEYEEYYALIEPERAEELYKQVLEDQRYDEEVEDYANAYSAMKPAKAAGIFEAMTDDLELAADILSAMGSDSRGDILGEMDPDIAAQITKIMEP